MVGYVREMIAKKSCKYGEYGLFEHMLFLLFYMKYEVQFVCVHWFGFFP